MNKSPFPTPPQQRIPEPASARQFALAALEESFENSRFITDQLDRLFASANCDLRERRLATELACGIVRRRATLNLLLQANLRRPRAQIEDRLWTILELGAYQLLATAIPPHAAVAETVELAKWVKEPRWCGFINGVLRAVSRGITNELAPCSASDSVPLTAGEFRRLNAPVFPDPVEFPVEYFAAAFSFPRWLAKRWQLRFDNRELERIGFQFNTPTRPCLRVNRLKTDQASFLEALQQAGVAAHEGEYSQAVRLDAACAITDLPGFAEGWFAVQDESAMHAAQRLNPQPGETVLDMCAAPGTKTTHLAELMNNEGRIVATDVDERRLVRIRENCQRLGIGIVETQVIDRDGTDVPVGPFDGILVDAPCSNTGVLGKRPDARWRIREDDLYELPEIQRQLLETAFDLLKPGGRVVYSTCSIEPEENEQVVAAMLSQHAGIELCEQVEFTPNDNHDGGFQALLRKR